MNKFRQTIHNKITSKDKKDGDEICTDEFNVLNHIGLSGIEWLITPNDNLSNPLFIESYLPTNILSVCVDTMVNNSFYKDEFMNKNLVHVLDKW